MGRNRVLVVGQPKSGKMGLLKHLTGEYPRNTEHGHAGLQHHYYISNKYYSAKVDIWVDEFGGKEQDSVEQWVDMFCSEEAKEVRDVIGAVVYTFDPTLESYENEMESMGKFLEKLDEEMWEGISIAACNKNEDKVDEKIAFEYGFELVGMQNEPERLGEALETYPWESEMIVDHDEAEGGGNDDGDDDEDNWDGIDFDNMSEKDMQDIANVISKLSYNKPMLDPESEEKNEEAGGSEQDVENLEKFMDKLRLAREDKEMSNDDRKKLSKELATELLQLI